MRSFDAIFAFDHEAGHSNVGDVMLSAGIGAAGDFDAEFADGTNEVVHAAGGSLCGEMLTYASSDGHAFRNGEGAIVGARAGDDIGDMVGVGFGEVDQGEGSMQGDEVSFGDPAKDEVLGIGRADFAIAILTRYFGKAAHLFGRDVTQGEFYRDDAVPRLFLGDGVGGFPARKRLIPERNAAGR